MHLYAENGQLISNNTYVESIDAGMAFLGNSNYLFHHFQLFLIVRIRHIFLIGLYLCLLDASELEIDAMFDIMYLVADLLDKAPPIGYELIDLLALDVIVSVYGLLHEFVVDDVDVQQVIPYQRVPLLILFDIGNR